MSDHSVVTAEVNIKQRQKRTTPRKVYIFKKMNLENLKNRTSAFQQEFLQDVDSRSPNENWKYLKANTDDMLKENVPQKTIRERWDVPYMTPEIKKLIRKKKRVYNTIKNS